MDGHSSGAHVAMRFARPTRMAARKTAWASRPVPSLFGLAPGGVYQRRVRCRARGALLPHRFTLATSRDGGLFSVALSLGLPPPGVTRHRFSMEPGLSSRGL